jgi:hypothetical protein
MWGIDAAFLHYDNTRLHVAKSAGKKFQDLGWITLLYPSYSPDIASSDFTMERFVRVQNFSSLEEVNTALLDRF